MSAAHRRGAWQVGAHAFEVELALKDGRLSGTLEDAAGRRTVAAQVQRLSDGTLRLEAGGQVHRATVLRLPGRTWVAVAGSVLEVRPVEAGRRGHHGVEDEPFAISPMTGLLVKVAVTPGQSLAEGAPLFVVEAMKMEFVVKAPRAVKVTEVRRKAGDKVALGEVVVAFAEEA